MKFYSAIVSLLVVAAAISSTHAAKSSSSKTKGVSASVYANSCSECGCTTLNFDASESSTRQGSDTFTTNNVNVYASSYDYCTGVSSYGYAFTTFGGFPDNWVKKNGPSFTLDLGVLDLCSFDYYGGTDCLSLSGSVIITPTSDYTSTSTCRGTDTYNSPFLQGKTIYNNSSRSSAAKATINISIDGVPASFNDFDVSASINDSKSKTVDKTVTVPY